MLKKFMILALFIGLLFARVVVDGYGKEVQIPDNASRIAPIHHTGLQASLVVGDANKIVFNSPHVPSTPLLHKIFPKIKLNPIRDGSYVSNVEATIALKPQIAFGPVSRFLGENAKKQLESAGIVVVDIEKFHRFDEMKKLVSKVGEIFGSESIKKAQEWTKFTENNVNFLTQRVANLKNKKRVLYLSVQANNFTAMGDVVSMAQYIKIAGGINAGANLSYGVWNQINEEQILVLDPDIIITRSDEDVQQILANPTFKWLKAVKNKQIYKVPSGVFWWAVPNAEGTMSMLWLAKILYPELFADLNLEAKVREFYEKFYDYKLSDEELKLIFDPKDKRL